MEKVLLRVAGVGTEMSLHKILQAFGSRLALGKIEFADGFLHPDINWESVLKTIGKKQNTIGDLFAHARERAERIASFRGWHASERFLIDLAGRNDASGFKEI